MAERNGGASARQTVIDDKGRCTNLLPSEEIPRATLVEVQRAFFRYSAGDRGSLTFSELCSAVAALGASLSVVEVEANLARVGKSTEEKIRLEEFIQLMSFCVNDRCSARELRTTFRLMNGFDDGVLTIKRLREVVLSIGYNIPDDILEDMVAVAHGTNGEVHEDGFVDALTRRVDILDDDSEASSCSE
jgi:Ca2+-binding EF-hand superfamily protein